MKCIIQWLKDKRKPTWEEVSKQSAEVKSYWGQWGRIRLKNGVLYREWYHEDKEEPALQLIVPRDWRQEVLRGNHDDPCAGHLGVRRTTARVQKSFYWYKYKSDVVQWCRRCKTCQMRKGSQPSNKGKMKSYLVGCPLERVAVDIMGPLPESLNGNKYLLVVGDYFTKFVEAFPMPNQEATTVAEKLVEFMSRWGIPHQLHSDQGRQFESAVVKKLCEMMGIQKTRTTPYFPQSDGMVERFNRTVQDMLAKMVRPDQKDWDEYVPLALMAYRSSIHEATGYSPNYLMMGREIDLPINLLLGPTPDEETGLHGQPVPEYVEALKTRLHRAHEGAREKLQETNERAKKRHDISAKGSLYKQGDVVWVAQKQKRKRRSPKLQERWKGPYLMIQPISELVYKVQDAPGSKCLIMHFNNLKPYHGVFNNWLMDSKTKEMSEPAKMSEWPDAAAEKIDNSLGQDSVMLLPPIREPESGPEYPGLRRSSRRRRAPDRLGMN